MNNKYSDLAKDLIPVAKFLDSDDLRATPAVDALQHSIQNMDPESFAPNRTANNTEQMLELLKDMKNDFDKSEKIQKRNFIINLAVSIIGAIAALIAALPYVISLFQ